MDLKIPAFYILSRKLSLDEVDPIMRALGITPVWCSIVSDPRDSELAISFAPQVLRSENDTVAIELARRISREQNQPVLVIGEADLLDAVYVAFDGSFTREPVVKNE